MRRHTWFLSPSPSDIFDKASTMFLLLKMLFGESKQCPRINLIPFLSALARRHVNASVLYQILFASLVEPSTSRTPVYFEVGLVALTSSLPKLVKTDLRDCLITVPCSVLSEILWSTYSSQLYGRAVPVLLFNVR